MPSSDRTLCASRQCPQAAECAQHHSNSRSVETYSSMFDPYDPGEPCEYFTRQARSLFPVAGMAAEGGL